MLRVSVGRIPLLTIKSSEETGKARKVGSDWRRVSGAAGEKLRIESLYSYPSLKRERKGRTFFDRKVKKKFAFLLDKPFGA
jgi:hypothetical protein